MLRNHQNTKKSGVKRTVMLTGDVHEAGTAVAEDWVLTKFIPTCFR